MLLRKSLFIVASLLFLSLSLSISAGQYNHILSIGDDMPSFNALPSTSGKTLSSSDLTEDIVIMVSLANHCPWVRGMDQDLVALAKKYQKQSVRVLGVSVNRREDDRLEAMKVHGKKVGYTFDYVYDESQQLGRQLGASRTPEYFVFDKNRKLAYMGLLYNSPAKMNADGSVRHINGEVTEHYVANAVNALLKGDAVAVAETRAHGCSVKYEN